MQLKTIFIATTSSMMLLWGAAFAADQDKSEGTSGSKAEHVQQPAKKKVKPHSHPRDEKGIPTSDKKENKGAAGTATDKKMEPHSHMRDEKRMTMPSQPGSGGAQQK